MVLSKVSNTKSNTKNENKFWDLLNITFNSVYYIIISF